MTANSLIQLRRSNASTSKNARESHLLTVTGNQYAYLIVTDATPLSNNLYRFDAVAKVDVVLDTIGGDVIANSYGLLKQGVISETFAFTEEGVHKAHLLSETGHARGKIIVKMK
jgi:NADPH:quinone reductase-like Zn-dependent oxidoreductase